MGSLTLREDVGEYDYIFACKSSFGGGFSVKGVSKYESSSVLAGQDRVVFIDSFDTMDALLEVYPEAELIHPILQPQNTFSHLSDDGDGW